MTSTRPHPDQEFLIVNHDHHLDQLSSPSQQHLAPPSPSSPHEHHSSIDNDSHSSQPSSRSTTPLIPSPEPDHTLRRRILPSVPSSHQNPIQSNPDTDNFLQDALKTLQTSFSNSLAAFSYLLIWPIKFLLTILLPNLLPYLVLALVIYWFGTSFNTLLHRTPIPSTFSLLTSPLIPLFSPITYFYCTTLQGPFCGTSPTPPEPDIAQVARTVSGTAQQAADIFDSVVQLSDPNQLGLHQSEIWELALAVRWSTELEGKELLGDQLWELGGMAREVKDRLVELNGQGLNAFSFIAHEFSRIADLIQWVQSGKKSYSSRTVAKNVEILFDHLSTELAKLLNAIEAAIPLASRSVDLGLRVSERLHQERFKLLQEQDKQPLWRQLIDKTSPTGKQLHRDLSLTSQSISNLGSTSMKLEDMRRDLVNYRNNVALFKAALAGWHLADHGLTAEDELFSMRHVIENFRQTISLVKTNSRRPTHQIGPMDRKRDGPEVSDKMSP